MKRCPICQRTYPDDAQNFCLDDGASLLSDSAPPPQTPYENRAAPTQVMYPAQPTQGMSAAAPPVYPSYTAPRRKNAVPLVIGVAGLVVVGIIVAIVLVLKSSGTSKSSDADWKTLNGDKFTASLPGTPTSNEQKLPTEAGQILIKMNLLNKGSEIYAVEYVEYPTAVFASQDADTIMKQARDKMVESINGQVTSERAISQGSFTGKEITGKMPNNGYSFTMQLYLAKPRIYIILYAMQGDQPTSNNGRKFLDSFKITSS